MQVNPESDSAKADDPELKMEFIYSVYDSLREMVLSISSENFTRNTFYKTK